MKGRLLSFLVLVLLALPAQALADTHPFLGSIAGTPFAIPPSKPAPNLDPFNGACGVASDSAGRTYVSDYGNGKVAIFNSAGFLFSIETEEGENSPCALAVNSSGARLYGNYFHQGVTELFSGVTIDPERSTGVAVEPGDERVFVTHRTHVSVYEPDGTPAGITIGTGHLADAYGAAVSGFPETEGDVYVADAAGNTVKVFDPATSLVTPIQVIDGSDTPAGGFNDLADTSLAINPEDGHLFVVDDLQPGSEHPAATVYEFDETGAYVGQISTWREKFDEPSPRPPKFFNRSLVHGRPSGLAVNLGKVLVTSGNEQGSSFLDTFGPAAVETAPLQVLKAGTGEGTVASRFGGLSAPSSEFSGIECGLICAAEYELTPPLDPKKVAPPALILTAVPRPHSSFAGWSVAGQPAACPGQEACEVTISGPTDVTATFTAIPQQTLTVTRSGAGEGDVTSTPVGLDCGPVCSATFDQGADVTLTPEAAPGSEFTGWAGDCGGSGLCQVALDGDRGVTATFKPVEPPTGVDPSHSPRRLAITVIGTGAGTITSEPAGIDCGTPCSGLYAPGTAITLTAVPDSDSHFSGWSGCDRVAGNRCSVTLDTSKTLGAVFDDGPLLSLGALKLHGAKATLEVEVPGPGALTASAKQLAPSKLKSTGASTLKLPLVLNKAGKKALNEAKGRTLKVKATITFKPSGGGAPAVLTRTITFKKGNK